MGLRAELVDMRHQSPLSSWLGDKTRCTISPFSCCDRYYAHRQYGLHWQLYPHYCRCTPGVPNMPPYYAACFLPAMLLIHQIANTPIGNLSSIGQKCRMVSSLNLAFRLQVCLHSQQTHITSIGKTIDQVTLNVTKEGISGLSNLQAISPLLKPTNQIWSLPLSTISIKFFYLFLPSFS